jgi:molybdate transport system substrate-binding protein
MRWGTLAIHVFAAMTALLSPTAGKSAELKLIVATPMAGVVKQLGAEFERSTGHRLAATFVSGPIVQREIDAGGRYDLAISITPVIEALTKDGKLIPGTRADVAYAPVGVGIRAGAPKPDVATVDAFRKALLDAGSVAHSATGASGDHFKSVLERLGIAAEMQPKLRPMPADTIAQAVPSGRAEMIVVTASVIVGSGAEYVGPIPQDLQFYNRFAAAVGAHAADMDACRAFIAFITAPAAIPTLRANGMEPGAPK